MAFTELFIKRPVLSIVVSLLILLIGFRAATVLPIRQYPKLSNTVVNITTSYPGASADMIQGFITTPLEQAVASAEGVDYISSSSVLGTSTIQVYIKLNFDPNEALTEVLSKVNSVKYLIPKESNDPVITKSTGQTTAVMYIAFSSEELTASAISDYLSRVVQPVMATVDGVAAADILGGQSFAMRLWLDPAKMAGHGVSPAEVSAAIAANNFQAAAGQAKGYFTISDVTANTDLRSVDDFKRMIVKANDGGFVRMEDIAVVELAAQTADTSVAMNGEHAVFIGVQASPQGNPLNIVRGVRGLFPEMERNLPPSLTMKVAYDSTQFIQSSIDEVEKTLIEAVVVVVIVIFLFLASLRSVIIPVVTIPLSLVGVCSMMLALGFSFNLLTLLAMVLAIGLVVDDAIVVVENIHRHLEEGATPLLAATRGAREIVGPVISMTITLAAVYAPIGFLGGLTGALFREFAFTLAGAVIVSGVIALTLSPMMCSLFLRRAEGGRFARLVNRGFGAITRWYGRKLDRSLEYRPITGLFALTMLGLVGFLYMNISKELAPEEDQGIVFALTKAPKYANIDYLDYYGAKLENAFKKFPESDLSFVLNGISGQQSGMAGMLLKPWDERKRSSIVLKSLVQAELSKIEGINAFAFSLPPLPGGSGGLPVQMVINSTVGFQSVYEQMSKLKDVARKSGLFMVSDSDLEFNQPVVRIKVDRSKANELGITMQTIGSALATLLGGNYVNRFNLQGRSYQVIPQVPRQERLATQAIGSYYVKTATGSMLPLSTVVSIETATDPNALTHYNQLNCATFQAVPMPGVTIGQAVDFLEAEAKKLPAGFSHDFLADARQYVYEGNQLAITFAFAIIIIFLVLAAQFESLRDPFIIMISVPMAIVGALIPPFFGWATMNIYTQVGLLTLVGLISKHGILMVGFANELQLKERLDRRSAIEMAARVRLRPILMTTAAMVTGFIPLLTATGAGAASRFSIGLVLVAGMTVGTLFTLFVLPAVYVVFASDHRADASSGRAKNAAEFGLTGAADPQLAKQ
ncbi:MULTISPECIES: efflux RND transporter permease subunit [unclassified Bradyrhizobium]|uniref:efflux RND transporter permease subunit n=1 Tax=unclassified Bradyrhizobium TaxID=2631580 RepID=UPI001CD29D0E|nr:MULTISPECIES: efflux RND transporter permease subunit [unclassified Bradyrhizobium]MCA1384318.1 efflux RND transporter permease subunit [Bradyrhizobium sp. BRP05]MCA1392733.1 efflux RND transporter permease subunit [Bradyrhizobium sp. IC3123]MCA1421060.1 efflux RND transporter permease subunit [Bradyrhizobium sp. BRP23]MCA1428430.1 efflux RND transporter permease subunit [Bradyrhizobium sp. NBAIM16]MCA1479352.1 efflux RND transporter permease subunit [Bradyrhizobium sp. NBAIM08]